MYSIALNGHLQSGSIHTELTKSENSETLCLDVKASGPLSPLNPDLPLHNSTFSTVHGLT